MPPAPIIMSPGGFCGGWVFDAFRGPFEKAGHEVIALDLPGHGADERPSRVIGQSMSDYVKAVSDAARACHRPPVLLGHSLGGLVSLMAAQKVQTAAVVLLAPSSPWGIAGGTVEEAVSAVSLYALGPFWTMAVDPDYATLRHYCVDRMPGEARRAIFARMKPESGRALWETLNWWLDPFMTTSVDASRIKAPILVLAGEKDAVHPPRTVRDTAAKVGGAFHMFPDMSHWLPGEPGCLEVADYCVEWLGANLALSAA